jgi:hypothetical protein
MKGENGPVYRLPVTGKTIPKPVPKADPGVEQILDEMEKARQRGQAGTARFARTAPILVDENGSRWGSNIPHKFIAHGLPCALLLREKLDSKFIFVLSRNLPFGKFIPAIRKFFIV